jgi:hypothetical protein
MSRATCGGQCSEPHGHWSHKPCRHQGPHDSHVWDSEFFLYGPYRCDGVKS